jgi:hypothetical protein
MRTWMMADRQRRQAATIGRRRVEGEAAESSDRDTDGSQASHAKGSNTEFEYKVFVIGTATSGCQRLPGLAIELSSLSALV